MAACRFLQSRAVGVSLTSKSISYVRRRQSFCRGFWFRSNLVLGREDNLPLACNAKPYFALRAGWGTLPCLATKHHRFVSNEDSAYALVGICVRWHSGHPGRDAKPWFCLGGRSFPFSGPSLGSSSGASLGLFVFVHGFVYSFRIVISSGDDFLYSFCIYVFRYSTKSGPVTLKHLMPGR